MDAARLEKLHELKEKGVLSEAEFESEKRKLLNQQSADTELSDNNYAALMHLAQFAGYIAPLAGFIVPIVMWLIKRENPYIHRHGLVMANWLISLTIYMLAGAFLSTSLFVTGSFFFPALIMVFMSILLLLHMIFVVLAALSAKKGEIRSYPLSISFFKVSE